MADDVEAARRAARQAADTYETAIRDQDVDAASAALPTASEAVATNDMTDAPVATPSRRGTVAKPRRSGKTATKASAKTRKPTKRLQSVDAAAVAATPITSVDSNAVASHRAPETPTSDMLNASTAALAFNLAAASSAAGLLATTESTAGDDTGAAGPVTPATATPKKKKANKRATAKAGGLAAGVIDSTAAATTTAGAAADSGQAAPAAPAPAQETPPPAYDDPIGSPPPFELALKLRKIRQRGQPQTDEVAPAGTPSTGGLTATDLARGASIAGSVASADGAADEVGGRKVVHVRDSRGKSKATWSFHRAMMFLVFLALAFYDLATDVLVFVNTFNYIYAVNANLRNVSDTIYNYTPRDLAFNNVTAAFAEGCTPALFADHHTDASFDCYLATQKCVQEIVVDEYGNDSLTPAPPALADEPPFWEVMDNRTKNTCQFGKLYETNPFDEAFASLQATTWICLAFVIVSFITFCWAVYNNWKYKHFGASKVLFTFLLFFIEDIPQMTIQLIIFARRIQLNCYTCIINTRCAEPASLELWTPPEGVCTGEPSLASVYNVATANEFDTFVNSLTNPLLLLYLSLAGIALATLKLYARALSFKRCNVWLFLYIVGSPIILGCLWLPVLWTVWAFLLPTLSLSADNPVSQIIFILAIVCSAAFPFATYIVYRNVKNSIMGGNEIKQLEERNERRARSTTLEVWTVLAGLRARTFSLLTYVLVQRTRCVWLTSRWERCATRRRMTRLQTCRERAPSGRKTATHPASGVTTGRLVSPGFRTQGNVCIVYGCMCK